MATDLSGFIYDINTFQSISTNHRKFIQIWIFFCCRWFSWWDNQVSNEFFPLSIETIHKGILNLFVCFSLGILSIWSKLYRGYTKKYVRSTIEANIEMENQNGFCLKCVMFGLNVLSSWNTFAVLFRLLLLRFETTDYIFLLLFKTTLHHFVCLIQCVQWILSKYFGRILTETPIDYLLFYYKLRIRMSQNLGLFLSLAVSNIAGPLDECYLFEQFRCEYILTERQCKK